MHILYHRPIKIGNCFHFFYEFLTKQTLFNHMNGTIFNQNMFDRFYARKTVRTLLMWLHIYLIFKYFIMMNTNKNSPE